MKPLLAPLLFVTAAYYSLFGGDGSLVAAVPLPEYESNCPKCVTASNGAYFYCTKNNTCVNETIPDLSCE